MDAEQFLDTTSWYVIHTNPRQEDRAEDNLRAWGVETYFPKIKECRFNRFTDEPIYYIKPLFQGYIFARFEYRALCHKIRFTRGVQTVVSFGNIPIPVDDEIIISIKSRSDESGFIKLVDDLAPGDEVVIMGSPLNGFHGIFERKMKDTDRVSILLTTVQYQAHVLIEKHMIKKAGCES